MPSRSSESFSWLFLPCSWCLLLPRIQSCLSYVQTLLVVMEYGVWYCESSVSVVTKYSRLVLYVIRPCFLRKQTLSVSSYWAIYIVNIEENINCFVSDKKIMSNVSSGEFSSDDSPHDLSWGAQYSGGEGLTTVLLQWVRLCTHNNCDRVCMMKKRV